MCNGTDDFGQGCETGNGRWVENADPSAESPDFVFDCTGEVACYHVQHGQQFPEPRDFDSGRVAGRTAGLIRITGFSVK